MQLDYTLIKLRFFLMKATFNKTKTPFLLGKGAKYIKEKFIR